MFFIMQKAAKAWEDRLLVLVKQFVNETRKLVCFTLRPIFYSKILLAHQSLAMKTKPSKPSGDGQFVLSPPLLLTFIQDRPLILESLSLRHSQTTHSFNFMSVGVGVNNLLLTF